VEKLQCPNDVYTWALMSLLSDIPSVAGICPSPRLEAASWPIAYRASIALCSIYRMAKQPWLRRAGFVGRLG